MKFSKGVLLMMWASFLFTLMGTCVKALPHIPPVQLVWFRSIITMAMCVYSLKRSKTKIWGNNKKVLMARGLFGALSLMLTFTILQRIPLASASVLHYTSPVFTAILAALLLGERLRKIQWLFFAICFAGVMMVKGYDARMELQDLLMGIGAAFLAACAYICIRKLKNSENPLVIVFYFPLMTLPIASVICIPNWVMPIGWDWLIILVFGMLTQFAQVAMTKSYQMEGAAKIASVSYIGLIHALWVGFLFFNESFDWLALTGMAVMLAGVLLNVNVEKILPSKKKKKTVE